MRLYDLAEQYNDLMNLLEEDAGNDALKEMIDGIDEAFEVKVESIVKLMRSKDFEFEMIKSEIDRLSLRTQKIKKELDWLREYIKDQMIAIGKNKVKSALFNISLANNPPSVNVLNESVIPQQFYIIKPSIPVLDKRLILESIKNGESIPGVEIQQKQSLRVK